LNLFILPPPEIHEVSLNISCENQPATFALLLRHIKKRACITDTREIMYNSLICMDMIFHDTQEFFSQIALPTKNHPETLAN
jgi:hypothetical protein